MTKKIGNCLSRLPWQFSLALNTLISAIAIHDGTLRRLDNWNFTVNVPVFNWIYALLETVNLWGLEEIFICVGLAAVFYLARGCALQKNNWIRGISVFFSLCMLVGNSFSKTGSWDLIFGRKLQILLALFVGFGYYIVFKNVIVLIGRALPHMKLMRREPSGKIEILLFYKHPFLSSLLLIGISSIPVLVFFFPGTMQWDAYAQLLQFLGAEHWIWDGQQPVMITWLIGNLFLLGRFLFASDCIGIFFYTGTQYILQWLIFAYAVTILCRLKAPLLLRWGTLAYFLFFPAWRIWGYTLVKDTGHYLSMLLFVLLWIDLEILKTDRYRKAKWLLLTGSTIGIVISRNNGLHILLLVGILGLCFCRKEWKIYMICLLGGIGASLAVNVFMVQKGIEKGPVKEGLSIPIQQTGRYIKNHYDELTAEEMQVLSVIYSDDLQKIKELYDPEIADPIKNYFINKPTKEELRNFIRIWLQLFKKHPETYLEAFVNHTYGYFYPDKGGFWEVRGKYVIGNGDQLQNEYFNISFALDIPEIRKLYENGALLFNNFPVIGMLYSAGLHTFFLVGCIVYLLANKKSREIRILFPSAAVLLICLLSPVNAFFRYMLPIMVLLPVNAAWCCYVVHEEAAGME